MSKSKFLSLLFIILLLFPMALKCVLYDNRFVRIIRVPYSRERELFDYERQFGCLRASRFRGDVFIISGDDAFADADETIGIPEIFGKYNERNVGQALDCIGLPNPIPPQYQNMSIPWKMTGKIQGQGVNLHWDQFLGKYFYVGCSTFFMHVNSRQDFILEKGVDVGDARQLDDARRQMNDELGIQAVKWTETNMSDINCYFRVGNVWDYKTKMRRIDAGLRIGAIIPTGIERQLNNPASIPFGGNKFWGLFISADMELELKQDLKCGFLLRASKRLPKTIRARMAVKDEQPLYGAVKGPMHVNPGPTFVFSPYLRIDGIRKGFGFILNYTIVGHLRDSLKDKRAVQEPPVTLNELHDSTDWIAENLTLNLFYDFAKVKILDRYTPTVQLIWDIPVQYFGAEGVAKTNRIALGLQVKY